MKDLSQKKQQKNTSAQDSPILPTWGAFRHKNLIFYILSLPHSATKHFSIFSSWWSSRFSSWNL